MDWLMIAKFVVPICIFLPTIPPAFAQQPELTIFNARSNDSKAFVLRMSGPETRQDHNLSQDFRDLAHNLTPLKSEFSPDSTLGQHARNADRKEGSPKVTIAHDTWSPLQNIDLWLFPQSCALPLYSPSPLLPREAERRRAIWYPAMAEAACEAGVPIQLFDALIIQESRYNPVAVSPKGATGLAQLMPSSARILGVRNIWDPRENMRGGARYLRSLLDEFDRFDLALAAYNAGAGRVRNKHQVPRITETLHYVSGILTTMQRQLALTMVSRE